MQQIVSKSSPTGARCKSAEFAICHQFSLDNIMLHVQGYGRQGAAYHGLGDLKAAEISYRKGLEVEPGEICCGFKIIS